MKKDLINPLPLHVVNGYEKNNLKNIGSFFVTIVVKGRKQVFGLIKEKTVNLSELGKIVEDEWFKTFEIRRDMNLLMDYYEIMPDHFHGIIHIQKNKFNTNLSMIKNLSFGKQSNNISSIVRGFKSAVKTIATKRGIDEFSWQEGYHSYHINTYKQLQNIRLYIQNNPLNYQLK